MRVYNKKTAEIEIEELKKESTLFATRNEPAMKLLEVAQAHYQKFIKLMRRKKKNDEMMEMMTTMVKGKAKLGEGSGTLDNPILFYSDTRVYREDLPFQVSGMTIQIPRVNELPASEDPREVDKGKSIMDEEAHKFNLIEECLKAIEGLDTFRSVEVE
ncbi:hypothetical protein Gogos_011773, partial [Gossypium gossypioides]|nr:hypothetical protein [Gossypium gossypioides]